MVNPSSYFPIFIKCFHLVIINPSNCRANVYLWTKVSRYIDFMSGTLLFSLQMKLRHGLDKFATCLSCLRHFQIISCLYTHPFSSQGKFMYASNASLGFYNAHPKNCFREVARTLSFVCRSFLFRSGNFSTCKLTG